MTATDRQTGAPAAPESTMNQSPNSKPTPCVELSLPSGERASVALFGGQLLSWVTADGVERIYLSPKALFDGATPIRGGVPVCFPQFNLRGPLPKHGIARTLPWQAQDTGDTACARLRLSDSDATRRWWPQAFDATLTVQLAPQRLRLAFEVRNTDSVDWPFALALHSYLRVEAIEQARLCGLQGLPYWDAVEDAEATERDDEIEFTEQFDRVYSHVPDGAVLELRQGGAPLKITQSDTLTETVVWNPGADLSAALTDMPADGFRRMLCVEAAAVREPLELAPGASWWGRQSLVAM